MTFHPQYGVLVFREAHLDDERHIAFSRLFGPLDDITPYLGLGRKNRFDPHLELFDVSNLEDDGSIAQTGTKRDHLNKGNGLFHVDSSFNPRRAGLSCLRAAELPPKGTGGATEYADTRTAFDDLDHLQVGLKERLMQEDYIAAHNLWHSRKKAAPEFWKDVNPEEYPFGRHRLVQTHEPSGRTNLYVANHVHHIEGLPIDESTDLVERLLRHASQPKYVLRVDWENNGDLVIWDNTCVMHRAAGGAYEGKHKRDMRRTTVHDTSSHAWGLNERTTKRMGLP